MQVCRAAAPQELRGAGGQHWDGKTAELWHVGTVPVLSYSTWNHWLLADRDNMTAHAEGLAASQQCYCDYHPTPLPEREREAELLACPFLFPKRGQRLTLPRHMLTHPESLGPPSS